VHDQLKTILRSAASARRPSRTRSGGASAGRRCSVTAGSCLSSPPTIRPAARSGLGTGPWRWRTGPTFVDPTLFDHVRTDMDIYTDEIFGPDLVVVRAQSFDEAIEIVNANPYGNGTAVFTGVARPPAGASVTSRSDDRRQRPDPGANGLLLLRRLEGLAVRRYPRT
jgi:hypothetical protein